MNRVFALLILLAACTAAYGETNGDSEESTTTATAINDPNYRFPTPYCVVDTESGLTLYTFTKTGEFMNFRADLAMGNYKNWPRLEGKSTKIILCP